MNSDNTCTVATRAVCRSRASPMNDIRRVATCSLIAARLRVVAMMLFVALGICISSSVPAYAASRHASGCRFIIGVDLIGRVEGVRGPGSTPDGNNDFSSVARLMKTRREKRA